MIIDIEVDNDIKNVILYQSNQLHKVCEIVIELILLYNHGHRERMMKYQESDDFYDEYSINDYGFDYDHVKIYKSNTYSTDVLVGNIVNLISDRFGYLDNAQILECLSTKTELTSMIYNMKEKNYFISDSVNIYIDINDLIIKVLNMV